MKMLTQELVDIMEERYGKFWWPADMYPDLSKEPFKSLVLTVLSQNTSEVNCIRAYRGLAAKFDVTPEVLAEADLDSLKESIRSGGLYNVKAKRIKDLAKAVIEKFGGNVASILDLPKEKAKERLMELPGIGPKTADVLLTDRYSYREVLPIDTHYDRIAKRLGLVKSDAGYGEIQNALMGFVPMGNERASGLLWLLAKYTCRAQNPKCYECPIVGLCDYEKKTIYSKR
jgi:endonuclease-3